MTQVLDPETQLNFTVDRLDCQRDRLLAAIESFEIALQRNLAVQAMIPFQQDLSDLRSELADVEQQLSKAEARLAKFAPV